MIELPLLSLMIFLPLFGSLFIIFIPGNDIGSSYNARAVALFTSFVTFSLSVVIYLNFDSSIPDFQFIEKHPWLSNYDISYHLGVDGISMSMILLTTFLTPIALISTWKSVQHRVKEYMLAFLILETLMIGTFCALDLVLFYVFFEAVLIPMYLIIGVWGGKGKIYASYKFFLYTLLGSILMLIAILYIYSITGTTNVTTLFNYGFSIKSQTWLWLAFFASFAVKIPMWPFHTWLPDAHVEAPTAGSVILAAILLKIGGYGFIRFSLPILPEASLYFSDLMILISIIGILYASFIALVQKDMKKLLAYASIAHMGFVTIGIFTFNIQGIQGSIFQMISHGLISAALFLIVGVLYDREKTKDIEKFGGLATKMPVFATVFMIFVLASIGLPGTNGFIGEILILISSFKVSWYLTLLMGIGIILSAAYMLSMYRNLMFGKIIFEKLEKIKDLNTVEKICLIPIVVVVILYGIYPDPILKLTELSAQKILEPLDVELIKTSASDFNLWRR